MPSTAAIRRAHEAARWFRPLQAPVTCSTCAARHRGSRSAVFVLASTVRCSMWTVGDAFSGLYAAAGPARASRFVIVPVALRSGTVVSSAAGRAARPRPGDSIYRPSALQPVPVYEPTNSCPVAILDAPAWTDSIRRPVVHCPASFVARALSTARRGRLESHRRDHRHHS